MGSAVSISPIHSTSSTNYYKLLNNSEEILKLFKEISSYGTQEGQINLKNKISLTEMLLYIEKGENIILKEALGNTSPEVIKIAYEFAIGKKLLSHEMNKKEFLKFLPIVYLFDHLWKIFDMADSSIDDRRIFPNEFLTAKFTIESIQGVKLQAITREEWEKEFHILDKNKDGFISFNEFCKYAVSKIVTPESYLQELKRLENDEFPSLTDPTESLNPLNQSQVLESVTITSNGIIIEQQGSYKNEIHSSKELFLEPTINELQQSISTTTTTPTRTIESSTERLPSSNSNT